MSETESLLSRFTANAAEVQAHKVCLKLNVRANERNGKLAFAFYSECGRGSSTQSVFKAKDLLLYNSLVIASWYFLEIGMLSKLSCLSSATMVPVLSLCTIFMYAGLMK